MKIKNIQIFSIVACLLLVFFASNITFSQWQLVGAVTGAGPNPCISVVDESTVFIFGGVVEPAVFRSTDGGENFTTLGTTGLGSFPLTCGWAVDTNLIFAGNGGDDYGNGGNASFYKSIDGGTSWTKVDSTGGTSGFFNGIVFSRTTPMFGVAESDAADGPGNPFLLWLTTDGGITWNKTTAPSVPGANYSVVNSIMVIDDQFYGFGLWGSTSQIYMTTDGGSYWFVGDLGITGDFVYGFAFSEDKMRGIAGAPYALPTIARTSDGGVFWDPINTNTGITNSEWYQPTCKWIPYTDVCYFAGGFGSGGVIAKSMDGGLTWEAMTTDGMTDIYHMEIYSAVTTDAITAYGYAVTGAGRVLKLVDIIPDIIHVPGDYLTIQEGIDAAVSGNVVLVDDGTYLENINFSGKAITVASHFLINGDSTHIDNTIIDGSQPVNPDNGSVVSFVSGEDTNSVLCGFTITNGTGTIVYSPDEYRGGGGIFCVNSGARIESNLITNNTVNYSTWSSGGGICVDGTINEYVIIQENQIVDNSVNGTFGAFGGGIEFINSSGKAVNNLVFNNKCVSSASQATSGGMGFWSDNPVKPFVIIKGNEVNYNTATGVSVGGNEGATSAGLGIYRCNGLVLNNKITYNIANSSIAAGSGILCQDADYNIIIDGNYIANNTFGQGISGGGGLLIFNSAPSITNNIIENNRATDGGGIYFVNSNANIINNTIVNNAAENGGGIYSQNSDVIIMNTIVWANQAPDSAGIYHHSGDLEVRHSDVQGGWSGEGNINAIPSFSDTLFHLSDTSLCIGAGIESIEIPIGGTMYYCPPFCYDGNPRPNPSDSKPDIGACESPLRNPVGVEDDISQIPVEYSLAQNYPNPFNPTTKIKYHIPELSFVTLKIFDVLGREIETIVGGEQNAGFYEIEFNASRLASGIYFYRLQAGNYIETKKMLLLK
jgi:hypothetical protein